MRTERRIERLAVRAAVFGIVASFLSAGLYLLSNETLQRPKIDFWSTSTGIVVIIVTVLTLYESVIGGRFGGSSEAGSDKSIQPVVPTLSRWLRYLGIPVYVFVTYGGIYVIDYLIIRVIRFLLADELQRNLSLVQILDWLNIGLAIFCTLAAVTHGFFSVLSQVRLDSERTKETSVSTSGQGVPRS